MLVDVISSVKKFAAALGMQRRVVHALMLREMLTHFGREHLGLFWLMGEPMILTVGVMVLWTFGGTERGASIGIIPFALTGYTIITLFRHLTVRLMISGRSNISLMFHRNVHYLDALISRGLLEAASVGLSFIALYTSLYVTGFIEPLYDPYLLVTGWLLAAWFSFGFGLIIAAVTQLFPVTEKFVAPLMYITLPLTGLFFMISWLPDRLGKIMAWSPLANCFELFRDGMFGHNVSAQWDAWYIIKFNVVMTAIGLLLVCKAQRHIRFE
jgi:capsular polysaccharide transport system permease protein